MGPARVYFFFISGSKKGRIEAIEAADVIRIGRQPYCELALDPYQDIPASGDHARVVREGPDRWALVDSGSSWGTWKNDVRVMGKVPLLTGDVITCGHDDRGRAGPRIRFYQDKDILRCLGCDGPVYKRHFRCPTCTRKYCLRCIDFRTQTCKPCGLRTAAMGAPPRPVIQPPLAAPTVAATRIIPVPGGSGLGDDGPFCNLCNEGVRVPVFTCGSCRRTFCVDHRQPSGSCPLCAGAGQVLEDWGRGSEPELRVPDQALYQPPGGGGGAGPFTPPFTHGGPTAAFPPPGGGSPFTPFSPAPPTSLEPPTQRRDGPPVGWAEPNPDTRSMLRPEPTRAKAPPTGRPGPLEGGEGELNDLSELPARKPPTIPCERCQAPLAARDFFVCSMCRGRLCSRHRSGGGDMCDLCASNPAGPPTDLGRELMSTAGDDAAARAPWKRTDHVKETTADTDRVVRRDLAETLEGEGPPPPPPPPPSGSDAFELSGVQFECPYCDAPITPSARTCPKCQREL